MLHFASCMQASAEAFVSFLCESFHSGYRGILVFGIVYLLCSLSYPSERAESPIVDQITTVTMTVQNNADYSISSTIFMPFSGTSKLILHVLRPHKVNIYHLPLPVLATPMTSLPLMTSGMQCSWMGVGLVMPTVLSCRMIHGLSPRSSKVFTIWHT